MKKREIDLRLKKLKYEISYLKEHMLKKRIMIINLKKRSKESIVYYKEQIEKITIKIDKLRVLYKEGNKDVIKEGKRLNKKRYDISKKLSEKYTMLEGVTPALKENKKREKLHKIFLEKITGTLKEERKLCQE